MRKLVILAIVVAAGILGYNHFYDVKPASAEAKALTDLEHRLDAANDRMVQAGRAAGMAGIDTTADVEAAHAAIRRVEQDLQNLKGRLADDASRRRAAALEQRIRELLGT